MRSVMRTKKQLSIDLSRILSQNPGIFFFEPLHPLYIDEVQQIESDVYNVSYICDIKNNLSLSTRKEIIENKISGTAVVKIPSDYPFSKIRVLEWGLGNTILADNAKQLSTARKQELERIVKLPDSFAKIINNHKEIPNFLPQSENIVFNPKIQPSKDMKDLLRFMKSSQDITAPTLKDVFEGKAASYDPNLYPWPLTAEFGSVRGMMKYTRRRSQSQGYYVQGHETRSRRGIRTQFPCVYS
jgi:hypothetical protein